MQQPKRRPGRPPKEQTAQPAPTPAPAVDPKIAGLQKIVADRAVDVELRLAAMEKLTLLQSKPKPTPGLMSTGESREAYMERVLKELKQSEPPSKPSMSAEMRIVDLTQRLHRAASKGDADHCARIVAIWRRQWPDTPIPQYHLAIPAPVQTPMAVRMQRATQAAREDIQGKLKAQLDAQAHRPIYRAGDRQEIPKGEHDPHAGDWRFSEW